jgi:hypothetical protein
METNDSLYGVMLELVFFFHRNAIVDRWWQMTVVVVLKVATRRRITMRNHVHDGMITHH